MPFRKRSLRERCTDCSKFLHHQEQKEIGICTDCVKKEIKRLKTSHLIRALIGLIIASIFLALVATLNVINFRNTLTALSATGQALVALGCFLFPFARLIKIRHLVEGPRTHVIDEEEFNEAGFLAAMEFFISAFTGPIFFVHGLYRIGKLSS